MRTLEVRIQVEYSSLYLNVRGRIYYRNQHLSIYVLLVDAWFIWSLYLLQVLYHKSDCEHWVFCIHCREYGHTKLEIQSFYKTHLIFNHIWKSFIPLIIDIVHLKVAFPNAAGCRGVVQLLISYYSFTISFFSFLICLPSLCHCKITSV